MFGDLRRNFFDLSRQKLTQIWNGKYRTFCYAASPVLTNKNPENPPLMLPTQRFLSPQLVIFVFFRRLFDGLPPSGGVWRGKGPFDEVADMLV
jgi:hypothetical protein